MKISVWCPYYPPHTGGLEQYASDLHRQLAALGHRVTVFTPCLPPNAVSPAIPNLTVIFFPAFDVVYNWPFPRFWRWRWWSLLWNFWRQDADVVISYTRFFFTSWLALLHARSRRLPWLHVEHGSGPVLSSRPLINYFARLVDLSWGRAIFSLSTINVAPSSSARLFINRFNSRPVPLIYRGFDYRSVDRLVPYRPSSARHKFLIVFAGRFIASKNIPSLFQAMADLKDGSLHLCLAGTGNELADLQRLARTLGLSPQIDFLGELNSSQARALIKAADLVINPSLNEGLPTVVLEAAACRRAIIASDVGGTSEIITHLESGWLYDPRDRQALINAIAALKSNPSFRHRLGESARRQTEDKFNWPTATASYLNLISQVV